MGRAESLKLTSRSTTWSSKASDTWSNTTAGAAAGAAAPRGSTRDVARSTTAAPTMSLRRKPGANQPPPERARRRRDVAENGGYSRRSGRPARRLPQPGRLFPSRHSRFSGSLGLAVGAYGVGYLALQPELTLHDHGCCADPLRLGRMEETRPMTSAPSRPRASHSPGPSEQSGLNRLTPDRSRGWAGRGSSRSSRRPERRAVARRGCGCAALRPARRGRGPWPKGTYRGCRDTSYG